MVERWKSALRESQFRWHALLSVGALVVCLYYGSRMLEWVQTRPGVVLDDPVLAWLTPTDFTVLIFVGIYAGLLLTIYWAAAHPWRWVMGVRAYCFFLIFRIISLWLAPFEAPPTIIPLEDPIVSGAAGGTLLTRDLFFSGHTATGVILTLVAPKRWQRWSLALITTVVVTGVLWQHVHYTVDVAVAPFIAYACYRMALAMTPRARLPHELPTLPSGS